MCGRFQPIRSPFPQSNPGAAGIKAIKFRDPEGHDLELIYFPRGKGNASWQKPTNRLFRGIDHTAMTVDSTDKGVTFYRDLLGFEVGGVTLNTGPTQEVLDGLFNDTCLVTAMMPAAAPPHVEFLEYKTPPGGRPMPRDTRANDLWHWQTTLVTKDIRAVDRTVAQDGRAIHHARRGGHSARGAGATRLQEGSDGP